MRNDQLCENYTALAHIYDRVMEEINYDSWADFLDEIMQTHHPDPHRVLELGCGTGILTLSLDELMCYKIMATDKSSEMIAKARQKADNTLTSNVTFKVADFMDLSEFEDEDYDVVLLTFDSINYLHEASQILSLLDEVRKVLKTRGLFIFDFTTPLNSEDALEKLDGEEGYADNYYYYRESKYNSENRIHTNIFTIRKLDASHETIIREYKEVHKQRIYSLREMEDIIEQSNFNILSKYGDFNLEKADENSLRVTMTLQCPKNQ